MYFAVKTLLASILGTAAVLWFDEQPFGALVFAVVSALMWLAIIKDIIEVLRFLGL